MKKAIHLLLAMSMLIGMIPTQAFAAGTVETAEVLPTRDLPEIQWPA